MEIRGPILTSALPRVTESLFIIAMFCLPWINFIRISTFLFIALGGIMLISGIYQTGGLGLYKKQLLFWLFLGYYILQVVAWSVFPQDVFTHAGLERKASLFFIPLLLCLVVLNYENIWENGINGFIYGCTLAAFYCFINAVINFVSTKKISTFFYHQYSNPIKQNAIYFSLYLLIALFYLVINSFFSERSPRQMFFMSGIGFFLFVNLLLLSSKAMIAIGSFLLIIMIVKTIKIRKLKIAAISIIISACIVLAITNNPVKTRYSNLNYRNYVAVFSENNFANFPFDGLSIRLLLWRLGNELINANRFWLCGAGGERYHEILNTEIIKYHLSAGNGTKEDPGYQNYNMHNQYMETYLQFGIVGLLLLISVLYYILWHAKFRQYMILGYVVALFSLAFLTESVLETQSGILLFTIIISGEWIHFRKKVKLKNI